MQRKLHYNEELGAFLLTYVTFSFHQQGWRLVCVTFPLVELRMFISSMQEKYPGLRGSIPTRKIPSWKIMRDEFEAYSEGAKWL